MRELLQDFVPYDQSLQWRLHDAYFARRGAAAWTDGDIPSFASNNYAIARQHAMLLVELVREMESAGQLRPHEEVGVLEVGSGLGDFACQFLRALEDGCGTRGRALVPRLRYFLSDYSEKSVSEASRRRQIAPHVNSGRVVPALFDLRLPDRLQRLSGTRMNQQMVAVIANYVCCVLPLKIIRKKGARYFEQHVRLELDRSNSAPTAPLDQMIQELLSEATRDEQINKLSVSTMWRAAYPETLLPNPLHGEILRRTLGSFEAATLPYPYVFLEFLQAMNRRLRPGGMVLINDFGTPDPDDLRIVSNGRPRHYGNTLNHPMHFTVFDAFSEATNVPLVRTHDALRSIHTAALRFGAEASKSFENAFRRTHVERIDGEDLLDFDSAAQSLADKGEHDLAVRLYQRALRLDPDCIEVLHRCGASCVEGGLYKLALEVLERGMALDTDRTEDFAFQLGRAHYGSHNWDKAIELYKESLKQERHPITLSNLGMAYEKKQDYRNAVLAYRQSLELAPDDKQTQRMLEALEETRANAGDVTPQSRRSRRNGAP